MDNFDRAFVLTRVMTSGIVMSIEKNDKELPALEQMIRKFTKRPYVSIFNSVTGAVHGALWGQNISHGDQISGEALSPSQLTFIRWLGIVPDTGPSGQAPYHFVEMGTPGSAVTSFDGITPIVLDFTSLGFGPSAAVAFSDELEWKRAERLKIFGALDLRTMWTQEESCQDVQPAVQFNYRLSPLVAACIRIALIGQQPMKSKEESR